MQESNPVADAVPDMAGGAGCPSGAGVSDVSADQPALMRARQISDAAVACGFEWETLDDVWAQVAEEIDELKEAFTAVGSADADALSAVELELGDVLFSLVNVGRRMGVDAEVSLHATCRKFSRRWAAMEDAARANGVDLADLSTTELGELWLCAKLGE